MPTSWLAQIGFLLKPLFSTFRFIGSVHKINLGDGCIFGKGGVKISISSFFVNQDAGDKSIKASPAC